MLMVIIGFAGFGLLFIGGFMYGHALDYLAPEYRERPPVTVYWRPSLFAPAGRRVIKRAFAMQLSGIALLVVAAVVG